MTLYEYAKVELLYRYLRINYEKEGDLKRAGDFHYGEMEMHRRANPGKLWYQFYWALSGYGERPVRALIWLLSIIPGLALLVWSLGIDKLDELQNIIAPAGFLDTLMYIFEKASLQRPTWLKPQGFWSTLFANLSVLLIPGQVALFFLALRNRLGRRR